MWLPACHRNLDLDDPGGYTVLADRYAAAVTQLGLQPVLFPMAEAGDIPCLLPLVDGVLLTGSPSNVEATHFGETALPTDLLDPRRDQLTMRRCAKRWTAQCRCSACAGVQEINVALGGSLYQSLHEHSGMMDHREPRDEDLAVQFAEAARGAAGAGSAFAHWAGGQRAMVNSLHGRASAGWAAWSRKRTRPTGWWRACGSWARPPSPMPCSGIPSGATSSIPSTSARWRPSRSPAAGIASCGTRNERSLSGAAGLGGGQPPPADRPFGPRAAVHGGGRSGPAHAAEHGRAAGVLPAGAAGYLEGLLANVDGVLLGGSDTNVDPRLWGEQPLREEFEYDVERDRLAHALIRTAMARRVPVLGFCHGCHDINVALGGSLHQWLPDLPGAVKHWEDRTSRWRRPMRSATSSPARRAANWRRSPAWAASRRARCIRRA